MTVGYTVVDAISLEILRSGLTSSKELVLAQKNTDNERVFVGEFPSEFYSFNGVMFIPLPPKVVVVSAAQVSNEQRRRLSYTDGYITRAQDPSDGRPVPEWAVQQRIAIREASRTLEAMDPIPEDYRDDKYWM